MPPTDTQGDRSRVPPVWVLLAASLLLLLAVPLVGSDLRKSLGEQRVLRAGTLCTEAVSSSCLVAENVTLSGPSRSRFSALGEWRATGTDGRSWFFLVRPVDRDAVAELAGVGVVLTVDDDVVALSSSASAVRIPAAATGSHAVVSDLFGLLALVGAIGHSLGVVRASRSAGTAWSAAVPARLVRFDAPVHAVLMTGLVGLWLVRLMGMHGVTPWAVAVLAGAGVLVVPRARRRLRKARGSGRHAA